MEGFPKDYDCEEIRSLKEFHIQCGEAEAGKPIIFLPCFCTTKLSICIM